MADGTAEARASLVELLEDLVVAPDADLLARIADPVEPVTFDEVGLDSLALLTLAIDLDAVLGIALSVEDLTACGDLVQLAALIADRA